MFKLSGLWNRRGWAMNLGMPAMGRRVRAGHLNRACKAVMEGLEMRQLLSVTTWYVNNVSGNGLPVGLDTNPGTIGAPFLSINAAAQVAQAGDTVLIGGSTTPSSSVGVYRETVKPKYTGSSGNTITYAPYNNQYVTVSGADQLSNSGWSLVAGTSSTYQMALNTNTTTDPNPNVTDTANLQSNGEDQVFVNGQMVSEARSGSTVSQNPSLPVFSTFSSSVGVSETTPTGYVQFTISDSTLTQAETQNNAWAGGQIYILPGSSGQQWVAETANVLSSSYNTGTSQGTIVIQAQEGTNGSSLISYLPQKGDRYYLFGVEAALDQAGEWYHNSSTLYLWSPDSTNLTNTSDVVEVKRRAYAFDLTGKAYTNIQGINIFASTILTTSSSNYDCFTNITAKYISQYNSDNTLAINGWDGLANSGIILAGTGDQLTNSVLAFSAANVVSVTGSHAVISNNIIHDGDYFAGDQAVVNTDYSAGSDTISGNIIYGSGRTVVLIRDCPNLTIKNNDIYWGGMQANDCGGIYQYGGPSDVPDGTTLAGGTTEISNNLVHDMGSSTSDSGHKNSACTTDAAIYLDNFSQEYLVDHNVTYNTATGMILNRPGIDTRVVNNTFDAKSYSVGSYTKYPAYDPDSDGDPVDYDAMTQTMLENNIFIKAITDLTNGSGGDSDLNSTTYYPGIRTVTAANLQSSAPGVLDQTDHVYILSSTSSALGLGVPYHDAVLNKEVTAVSSGTTDDGAYETAGTLWYGGVAPGNLTPTVMSSTQINLSWTFLDPSQTGFRLQRATNSSFTTGLTTFTPSGMTYSDTGLTANTTYYYRVQFNDGSGSASLAGNTAFSSTANATTLNGTPAVPTGLATTPVSGTQINLTWNTSTGATSYSVERALNSGMTGATVLTTTDGTNSWSDSTAVAGTTYYYAVAANNGGGSSAYSTPGVSGLTKPSVPTGLGTTVVSTTQINLSWSDSDSTAPTYTVERALNSGMTGATVLTTTDNSASWNDTTASAGTTYYYAVEATNASGTSAYTAGVSGLTLPAVPGGLSATDVNDGQINLAWTDSDPVAPTYTVIRATSSNMSGATTLTTTDSSTTYSDQTANGATTYYYEVQASNASGASGYQSTPASATTTANRLSNLVETNYSSLGQIQGNLHIGSLQYVDRSYTYSNLVSSGSTFNFTGADYLELANSNKTMSNYTMSYTLSQPSFVFLINYNGQALPTSGAGGFVNTGKTLNGSYQIWETAEGASTYGLGAEVSSGNFYTVFVMGTPPATPSGLSATAISSSQVNLSWTNNATGQTGFTVERATDALFTQNVTTFTTVPNTTTYNDTSVSPATTYYYEVEVNTTAGPSLYSTSANATTPALIPSVPTGLATAVVSSVQINLSWNSSTNATSYDVERSLNSGMTGATVLTTTDSGTTYNDTTASAGTMYYYAVAANGSSGSSAYSSGVSGLTMPSVPTGLGTTVVSTTQINLSWGDSDSTAPTYTVERATNSSMTGATVLTTTDSSASYSDSTGTASTMYYYAVAATNASGTSSFTAAVSGLTLPATPTGISAATVSSSQINLSWSDGDSNLTGFTVQRDVTSGFSSPTSIPVAAGVFTLNDTGLTAGTLYYYRVYASNASGNSSNSGTASATTKAVVPTGLIANGGNGQVTLAWTASAGAASYNIYRSTSPGGEGTVTGTSATNSFTDTGLSNNTTYYYKVAAVDSGGGNSGLSAEASAQALIYNSLDINTSPLTGSTSYNTSTGVYTMTAGGSDIWGTADGFRFAYQTWTGDCQIVARVDSLTPIGASYTKGGVMIRNGLNPGDVSAMMEIQYPNTVTNVADLLYRANTNGTTAYTGSGSASITTPYWVMLQRVGNTFKGYSSPDGINWTLSSSQTLNNMGSTAYFGLGYTGKSNTTLGTGTFDNVTVGPLSPSGLSATAANSGEIDLAWTDNSSNETGFRIDRATSADFTQNDTLVTTTGPNVVLFKDTGLTPTTTYYYRVRATNALGDSMNSNTGTATTPAATPNAPSGLAATTVSSSEIDLAWTDNSNNETGFKVERATSSDFTQNDTLLTTTAANATSYPDTSGSAGTTYYYRVRATNGAGDSTNSNTATNATLPVVPTGVTISVGYLQLSLAWTASTGATSYNIYRSTTPGGEGTTAYDTSATPAYTDNGVTSGTTYYYTIAAVGIGGTTAQSTPEVSMMATSNYFANLSEAGNPTYHSAIQTNLQVGSTEFVDRSYTYTSVTSSGSTYNFAGADYIQTATSDRNNSGYSLTYTLTHTGYVYVIIYKGVTPPTTTGPALTDTGKTLMGAYEILRVNETAGTYTLGSEVNSNAFYTVFAMAT